MDRQALPRARLAATLEDALARHLAAEIESELAAMAQLVTESANAPRSNDIYARRARASIMYDLYGGVERIFEHIAKLNGDVPNAANWDQQLLSDMTLGIDGVRPAVIDDDLRDRLVEYRLIRFIPLATAANDVGGLQRLEERLPKVVDDLQTQVRAFTAWLLGD